MHAVKKLEDEFERAKARVSSICSEISMRFFLILSFQSYSKSSIQKTRDH